MDIDGTILNCKGQIETETVQALSLLEKFMDIYLVTSLPYPYAYKRCKSVWNMVKGGIFGNGSDIRSQNDIFVKPMSDTIIGLLEKKKISYSAYKEKGQVHKIIVRNLSMEQLRQLEVSLKQYHIVREGNITSITEKEATKLNGILYLLHLLSVEEKETIVVGNSRNDIPMLQYFACSFAVPTAEEIVKKSAAYESSLENIFDYI